MKIAQILFGLSLMLGASVSYADIWGNLGDCIKTFPDATCGRGTPMNGHTNRFVSILVCNRSHYTVYPRLQCSGDGGSGDYQQFVVPPGGGYTFSCPSAYMINAQIVRSAGDVVTYAAGRPGENSTYQILDHGSGVDWYYSYQDCFPTIIPQGFFTAPGQEGIYWSNGENAFCHVSTPARVTGPVTAYRFNVFKATTFRQDGICP